MEETFSTYTGMIRVTFDSNVLYQSEAIDTIRALEGVTTARSVDMEDSLDDKVTLSIKIRSLKTAEEAFNIVRKKALTFSGIQKVEIGTKTLEKT